MKSYLNLSLSLLLLTLIVGCKKDHTTKLSAGACAGYSNWSMEIQDEAMQLSNAAAAYGQNPTPENCQNYKDAAEAYIKALQDLKNCVPAAQKSAYQQSLDEAIQNLNDLNC